jgi:hypothetical protein
MGRGLGALLLSLCLGCGYSSTLRLPEEHSSVGLEVFGNDSPLPILERALYQSLDAQIARMVAAPQRSPALADVLVRGVILDYYRMGGVFGIDGQLRESGVNLYVRAWLVDRKTGQRIGAELERGHQVHYAVGIGASEQGALELALATLSQELVLDLFSQVNYDFEEDELDGTLPLTPRDEG